MSIVDNLFKFELFAVPVWKKAQRVVKNKDVDLFRKRWPIWSQRLHHFPEIEAELFSEIFKEKDIAGLQPYQKDFLKIFFEHTQLKKTNSFVATTLSRLCLSHNWEALEEIEKYLPFNTATHTVMACAMAHEATASFWERALSRPRMEMEDVCKYIQKTNLQPYDKLNQLWQKSMFRSNSDFSKELNIYGFYIAKDISSHTSVLPNFERESLWDYAVLAMPNDQVLQKIVNTYSLPDDQLTPIFLRKFPLSADFVYDLAKKDAPLCLSLQNILENPVTVTPDNIVEILEDTSPFVAPAFATAFEQIANEQQRERLMQTVHTPQVVSRRKM